MAEVLNCKNVSASIANNLTDRIAVLKGKGVTPKLLILRVGADKNDMYYESSIVNRCAKLDIVTESVALSPNASSADVLSVIDRVNDDPMIHACIVLRPLPDQKTELAACERLKPSKDVDCMTPSSYAKTFSGLYEGFNACTAEAVMEILRYYGVKLEGKNVVVLGRSLVFGRPVSLLMQHANATVTMCHSKTENTAEICRNADILVVGIGKAKFVNENYVNDHQIVVDAGINTIDGSICGDVDFEAVEPAVKMITPVPGGVGGVTTSILIKHIIEAAEASCQ